MTDIVGLVQDYKANIPLHMLEAKYKIPIHTIVKVIHAVLAEPKESKTCIQETNNK